MADPPSLWIQILPDPPPLQMLACSFNFTIHFLGFVVLCKKTWTTRKARLSPSLSRNIGIKCHSTRAEKSEGKVVANLASPQPCHLILHWSRRGWRTVKTRAAASSTSIIKAAVRAKHATHVEHTLLSRPIVPAVEDEEAAALVWCDQPSPKPSPSRQSDPYVRFTTTLQGTLSYTDFGALQNLNQ